MSTYLYPSRRPKVSEVHSWHVLLEKTFDQVWSHPQKPPQHITVQKGYPFPDYYRVIITNEDGSNKRSKLFFGEMAHWNVVRWAGDNGCRLNSWEF